MGTPHKHAEVIKAWADGVPIQVRYPGNTSWNDITTDGYPAFLDHREYRIKPEPKKVWVKVVKWKASSSPTAHTARSETEKVGTDSIIKLNLKNIEHTSDWVEITLNE